MQTSRKSSLGKLNEGQSAQDNSWLCASSDLRHKPRTSATKGAVLEADKAPLVAYDAPALLVAAARGRGPGPRSRLEDCHAPGQAVFAPSPPAPRPGPPLQASPRPVHLEAKPKAIGEREREGTRDEGRCEESALSSPRAADDKRMYA